MNMERVLADARLKSLFSRTFEHPGLKGKMDLVSLEWMLEMGGSEAVDASVPNSMPNDLWESLLRDGMRDPIIIGVGRVSRRSRLESGERKARLLLENGVLFAPASCYIGDEAITRRENGIHEGRATALWLPETPPMGAYPEKFFARPTETIPSAPAFAFEGWGKARRASGAAPQGGERSSKDPKDKGSSAKDGESSQAGS